jgi:ketosteroid isomerase-like protein
MPGSLVMAAGTNHNVQHPEPGGQARRRLAISRQRGEEQAMAHPNEDLLRRGYEAFATGDMNTVLALFDSDISWHVGGSNQTSGDYRGHQEVLGFFGKMMELSGGSFHLDVHDIVANDVHGVALVTAHGERDGQAIAVREANIWHLADGKVTEFWAFAEDQAALDKLFG